MSASSRRSQVGDLKALARVMEQFNSAPNGRVRDQRLLVAEFCRLLGEQHGHGRAASHNGHGTGKENGNGHGNGRGNGQANGRPNGRRNSHWGGDGHPPGANGAQGATPDDQDGGGGGGGRDVDRLSPRLRQTLERLLAGNSEKQIALTLHISRHTVHVYVKNLYKRFGVNTRAELLAQWVSGATRRTPRPPPPPPR